MCGKYILGPVMMDELLAVAPLARHGGVFISVDENSAAPDFFTLFFPIVR